tara:strand:+ start:245 stop:1396 length:1152 start_codon:yes stop_codon:yes gene_type:complete
MEEKKYIALGLMSGTSMDGVDASIISSIDGIQYDEQFNVYYEYDKDLYQKLSNLRDKISVSNDLKKLSKEVKSIEKEITLFHAKVVNCIDYSGFKSKTLKPDIIGFHGQTIFHNSKEKISVQLGDGNLLSQLTKKSVIYDFRQNDLKNGGQGAPLTPIFHKSLRDKFYGESLSLIFINIGGIANATCLLKDTPMFAGDIGPGNCLIDKWIRKNSKHNYDKDGMIARSGKTNELILRQALDNFKIPLNTSLDINEFDISFVRGLTIEDGASTLVAFTVELIAEGIKKLLDKNKYSSGKNPLKFIVCGGGRKNKYLLELLKKKMITKYHYNQFQLIDDNNVDGDFVESQAFAFLAIRSYLKLPISFPETTGCKKPISGGIIARNY